MHLGAELFQLLLVGDAEMLLLVDDDKADILELDGLSEQRMGADDDIDIALGETFLVFANSVVVTSREACAMLTG